MKQTISMALLRSCRRGFTLVELSVVMVLVILLASTLVGMFKQQVDFYSWLNKQRFIAEQAPLTNDMVVRIFSQADAFRLHTSASAALSQSGGTVSGGKAMVLGFSQADGTRSYGMVAFDDSGSGTNGKLVYHVLNSSGTAITSSWTISSGVADASFDVDADGVLLLTLTGPYDGQLTYAATPSL